MLYKYIVGITKTTNKNVDILKQLIKKEKKKKLFFSPCTCSKKYPAFQVWSKETTQQNLSRMVY